MIFIQMAKLTTENLLIPGIMTEKVELNQRSVTI